MGRMYRINSNLSHLLIGLKMSTQIKTGNQKGQPKPLIHRLDAGWVGALVAHSVNSRDVLDSSYVRLVV